MTFKEALTKKQSIVSPYIKEEIEFEVFVTPRNEDDFENYLQNIGGFMEILTDEYAIEYSRDSLYKICGLNLDNGAGVIFDNL